MNMRFSGPSTMTYKRESQTITAIRTFFLLMCLYPGVQQKAQAEIDALLGDGYERLPTLADRDSLPYVDAVLKECLRWNPVAPLGLYLPSLCVWIWVLT